MSGAYGFRNVLVHDYDDIRLDRLAAEHTQNVEQLNSFLQAMSHYLEQKR